MRISKSIFKTKTFWWNALSTGFEIFNVVSPVLGIPPGTVTVITNVGNIVLRRVTKDPVHIVTPHVG